MSSNREENQMIFEVLGAKIIEKNDTDETLIYHSFKKEDNFI